ncbi:MAG TPA: thiamine pyrophosphate-binding protein [Streptosporangiaceae bacterium]|nr:thiamine pyrophosphate-binding protein [Streptosporangiaceae bacterium]
MGDRHPSPRENRTRRARSGAELLLEVLKTEGVGHIFGNPGTTELALMDALSASSRISYVLGLHESVCVGMADGYARATGRPSFVNLHSAAGLGNAVGVLSNVAATRTPMVVTAGQQDQRHLFAEPFLSGRLTEIAGGFAKQVTEVHRLEDLAFVLRRAFRDAAAAPAGPVFLSIPMDLLEEETDATVPPATTVDQRAVPAALGDLAELVTGVARRRFAVVAGDEVASAGAVGALVSVAERLGCAVYGTPFHSSLVFPTTHPLWSGALPADASQMADLLSSYDRVLLIGSRGFMTFVYKDVWPLPEHVELLHLSPAAGDLGRTYPALLAVAGDPRATLEALAPLLDPLDPDEVAAAAAAVAGLSARRTAEADARADAAGPDLDSAGRMHPLAAVRAVLSALPPETTVVDEAVTNDPYVRAFHRVREPGRFLYSRGGGLGWGVAAALGVSLATDRSPVVAVTGDGSFLYTPQAFWTAVREDLPVVAVVLNNRGYLILRRILSDMRESGGPGNEQAPRGRSGFVGLDIAGPDVDLLAVAEGFGASAVRVDKLSDVGDAVSAALSARRPFLVEIGVAAPPQG